MELKEGAFYNGIDGYSIKVGKKFPDGKTLKDIIIYDHTDVKGNKNVTMADSGQMYNILDDQYLVLEMYNGKNYSELTGGRRSYVSQQQKPDPFVRNEFESQKVVFSLASFDLKRTKEELFASNRLMKNSFDLKNDADSMRVAFVDMTEEVKEHSFKFFEYHLQDIVGVYKQRAIERAERKRQEEIEKEMLENREIDSEDDDDDEAQQLTSNVADLEGQFDSIRNQSGKPLFQDTALFSSRPEADSISAAVKRVPVTSRNLKAEKIKKFQSTKLTNDRSKQSTTDEVDSLDKQNTFEENIVIIDSLFMTESSMKTALNRSLTHVRYVKNNMTMRNGQLDKLKSELNKFQLERYKKLSYAVTILIMFFIGAPLGSIIKRGGLGIPVLISISFFILFYIVSMISEKYTRTDFMDPFVAAWMANMILLPIGLFFMKQAKNDARLFDTDFYSVFFIKMNANLFALKRKFGKTKSLN
jgi:lipopolysaccharide export system permease protein